MVQTRSGDIREIRLSDPLASQKKRVTERSGETAGNPRNAYQTHLREKRGSEGAYGVPMVLQFGLSNQTRLQLTEGPFVDDGVVVGVVEQAWGDPGLRNDCHQCF